MDESTDDSPDQRLIHRSL
jgi:hypothetical protein